MKAKETKKLLAEMAASPVSIATLVDLSSVNLYRNFTENNLANTGIKSIYSETGISNPHFTFIKGSFKKLITKAPRNK